VPLAAIYYAYQGAFFLFKYWQSLYVEAKPNEWLVVMNNGKLKSAGIGTAIVRNPFDTVAVFPSRLVKIDVKTQQVTKEMQGLEVSSMIEWTVDKEGEGPMKAFKNLGQDLASREPRTANSMLSDMCSSILRAQISNSTIQEVIKNRQELREKIIKDMSEIVKGWGVHLETVEVTDVRILSGTLFSNMQTKFREQNRKTAEIQAMTVNNEIEEEKIKHDTDTSKRNTDTTKTKKIRDFAIEIEKKKRENGEYAR
jgi:regulator of protease activity HflC (stomatin/prohibitin superfamily)